jgi:cysteinyl-tRNA synthetase
MIRIFNTLSGAKENFEPREEGKVSMYVCGPTVYNYIHVGNGRAYLVFDIIKRYLRHRGYQVIHVQNFTDVDDKIINRAKEEGLDPREVAKKYEEAFHEDMQALHILPPDITPRATEHIPQMLRMIEGLIKKGHAYVIDGDVYFSVRSFPGYGKLSRRSLEEMRAGVRVEVDERKRDPMDFALWKAAKPGEPAWDSPWGPGRPGWHIECSAMSLEYLGMGFDIHGGGQDLIFPHHENEIAQSEGFTGETPFVRYWVHNGFVNINEEKMSKSLGNIILIRNILEKYHPDVLRMLVLQTHYRSLIDFDTEALEEAKRAYERLENCIFALTEFLEKTDTKPAPARTQREVELTRIFMDTERRFEEAMDEDFNTARALGVIFELVKELNAYLDEQNAFPTPAGPIIARHGQELLIKLCQVLGLFSLPEEERRGDVAIEVPTVSATADSIPPKITPETLSEQVTHGRLDRLPPAHELIDLLVEVRQKARGRKDWETADYIRSRLEDLGIKIEDRRDGPRWKVQ